VPIHHGQPVKDFLAHGAAKRLRLEQLPGYAPDLNPVEGLWNYLKRAELDYVRCSDLTDLGAALRRGKERLRHKWRLLQACVTECGYRVEPFLQTIRR